MGVIVCYCHGLDSSICQSGFTCMSLLGGPEHRNCSFFSDIDVLQDEEKRSVAAAGSSAE